MFPSQWNRFGEGGDADLFVKFPPRMMAGGQIGSGGDGPLG